MDVRVGKSGRNRLAVAVDNLGRCTGKIADFTVASNTRNFIPANGYRLRSGANGIQSNEIGVYKTSSGGLFPHI